MQEEEGKVASRTERHAMPSSKSAISQSKEYLSYRTAVARKTVVVDSSDGMYLSPPPPGSAAPVLILLQQSQNLAALHVCAPATRTVLHTSPPERTTADTHSQHFMTHGGSGPKRP